MTAKRGKFCTLMITSSQMLARRGRFLCALLAAVVATLVAAQPAAAFASSGEAQPLQQGSELRGTVYDGSGLPLIGALVAVALRGSQEPPALTVSDSSGRFVIGELAPGVYTLMARSFGFVSAFVPEVAVPRPEPMSLQLRSERQVASLLAAGAPLDLGWAFRPKVRDVLRRTEIDSDRPRSWLDEIDGPSLWDNLGGELSMWTMAPADGELADGRSATELSMGSFGSGKQSWVFRGQVADGGVIRARSDVSRVMSDSHGLRVGIGYAAKDLALLGIDDDARQMWVGSVAAEDYWRLGKTLRVGYGLRFEHYNYLQERVLVSPRIQVAFAPIDSFSLTTSVSYDAEAPGLAELRFQVDPLAIRYMDVLSIDGIDPERTLRYEVGVRSGSATTEVRARAFHDEVAEELVGIYLANATGTSDYMVANVGDSVTQGFEVDVRGSVWEGVSGLVSYAYGRRTGGSLPAELAAERGLLAEASYDPDGADVDVVHELAAGLETIVGSYDTRVGATYHWQLGVPVVRDGNLDSSYERWDVRVRQPLPFRALASDWAALVNIQNVFGRTYDGVFDFRLGDAPVLSRLVSGGLAVRF